MTVATELRVVRHIGNGSTTVFPFTFNIPTTGDTVVILETIASGARTVLTTSQYSIVGIDAGSGSVTYPTSGSAITSDSALIIAREVDYTQDLDITNQDGFYPETVEDQLDDIVYQIQQIAEAQSRAIRAPLGDANSDLELPARGGRKNKVVGFDADGDLQMTTLTVVNASALFETVADAAASTITTDWIRTSGYTTAGDGGGALYKRVVSEPTHGMKFSSTGPIWWEFVPDPAGIDLRQAGAVADNTTDALAAINNILGFTSLVTVGVNKTLPRILINGAYYVSNTIELKVAVHLLGVGSGFSGVKGSKLRFPANITGIIVHRENTTGVTTEGTGTGAADGSIIEGLHLVGGEGTIAGVTDATKGHGVWMRARAELCNVKIENFAGNGIHIVATSGGAAAVEGNANGWRVSGGRVQECHQNGIFTDGGDVNAGKAEGVDFSNNGRWGIYDSSFLGNTYVACQTDNNGYGGKGENTTSQSCFVHYNTGTDRRFIAMVGATETDLVNTTPGTNDAIWKDVVAGASSATVPTWTAAQPVGTYFHGGPIRTESANAHNVIIGHYEENGYHQFVYPTLVFGGNRISEALGTFGGFAAGATRTLFYGKTEVENHKFYAPDRDLTLGFNDASNSLMRLKANGDDAGGIGIEWDETAGGWKIFDHNNGGTPMLVSTDLWTGVSGRSGAVGAGYPYFRRGMFLGGEANSVNASRFQGVGTAAPTTGAWAKGDVVWNSNSAAGGKVGWVCVTAGTPGTWKAFGAIDP